MNFAHCHGVFPKESPIFLDDEMSADSVLYPDLKDVLVYGDMPTDTIVTNQRIHLRQISEYLDIPMEVLRQLNPQYQRDIVPGTKDYTICLPLDNMGDFIMNQAKTFAHRADELMNERLQDDEPKSASDSQTGVTYYTVQEGDNLSKVACKYNVSVEQIKAWNGLSSDFLNVGKKLKIIRK
jgi:membrane-bound lytic murein transglycosylase D